ncbi:MAG: hypothetical protein Q9160_006489 [Pyrenula sp. 1 TL-2023]
MVWRSFAPAVFLAATLPFLHQAAAQDNGLPTLGGSTQNNNGLPTATSGDPAAATSAAASSAAATTGDSSSDGPPTLTESKSQTTTLGDSSSSGGSMPTIADDSSSDNAGGLPTLAGGFHYPPPSVPPTAGAPYMQHSNLPEGTVFICVGAAIGFIALVILAWRMLVAWSINRSVKRAALASSYTHHASDTKALLPPPPSNKHRPRKSTGPTPYDSNPSLLLSEKHHRPNSRTSPTPRLPSQTPNPSSLFFSPTAGAGMHSASPVSMSQRASAAYLPAGYYNSSARPKSSRSPINDLQQQHPSPPSSPGLTSSHPGVSTVGTMGAYDSSSTLNLGAGSSVNGGRAPSTYLDEMMSAAPPPVPRHGHQHQRQESRGSGETQGSGERRVRRQRD